LILIKRKGILSNQGSIPSFEKRSNKMKKNVGGFDRWVRIILGIVIILLGFVFKSWWGLIGIIPLFTGLIGWCPIYLPFGVSTCKIKKEE